MTLKSIICAIVSVLISITSFQLYAATSYKTESCVSNLDKRVVRIYGFDALHFSSCSLTDNDMPTVVSYVMAHPNVRGLEIFRDVTQDDSISDASAVMISKSLPQLQLLYLLDTNVSDAGLASIASLSNLQYLSISGNFTDKSMVAFAKHPALSELDIQATTKIEITGLSALASIPNLRLFYADGNSIDDNGIKMLLNNKRLKVLSLRCNNISDNGAIAIANSPQHFYVVDVSYNKIGTEGLNTLKNAKNIDTIYAERQFDNNCGVKPSFNSKVVSFHR